MAPERIMGSKYTVKADVWSLGLTLMELATGSDPFGITLPLSDDDGAPSGMLDLLSQIVYGPSPRLASGEAFPTTLQELIDKCLMKDPEDRPTFNELVHLQLI